MTALTKCTTLTILALFGVAAAAGATQLSKLLAVGGSAMPQTGSAVAISGDGRTALLGAPANDPTGAFVFALVSGAWQQQGVLVPSGGVGVSAFGCAVSLSADGSTALIGASTENAQLGAAYVFVRSGTSWTQQARLVPTDGTGPVQTFGYSVSLSGDGNFGIVGAPDDNNDDGAAYVFARSGTSWAQQGDKLLPTGGAVSQQVFGIAVSLSRNGSTAVVGALGDNSGAGAAYVFVNPGLAWTQQARLLPTGGAAGQKFGCSVSLDAVGDTAVVGAFHDDFLRGAAYVFARTSNSWAQQGPRLVSNDGVGPQPYLGYSVSLDNDGDTALVGAYVDNNFVGGAFVFKQTGGTWSQLGPKLVPINGVGQGRFSHSVSLSGNGKSALLGAPFDNNQLGAAYVFCVSPPLGDMNCDCVVNNFDIDGFVGCLLRSCDGYPVCNGCADCEAQGDVNGDTVFNNFDIDPFVECILNGGCP